MASIIRGDDNFDSEAGSALKAWVNFNGTGTVAIRDSYNVSSITDVGTGGYRLNYTNALSNSAYSVVSTSWYVGVTATFSGIYSLSTSSCDMQTVNPSGTAYDASDCFVAIFGN